MKASLNPLAAHRDSRESSSTRPNFDIANMNNQQSRHYYLGFQLAKFEIYILDRVLIPFLGIERSRGKKNHDLVIEANIEGYYSQSRISFVIMKAIATIAILFMSEIAVFISAIPVQANPRTCDVVRISDGDTVRVSCNGNVERIRFCGIDAPEKKQELGKESTNYLKRLLGNGQVTVVPIETDRFGRTVAELFVGNTFINAEVVKAGYAYEYKKYSKKCPNRLQIRSAEAIAQKNKVGVWNGDSYELPWDFRKRVKRQAWFGYPLVVKSNFFEITNLNS